MPDLELVLDGEGRADSGRWCCAGDGDDDRRPRHGTHASIARPTAPSTTWRSWSCAGSWRPRSGPPP